MITQFLTTFTLSVLNGAGYGGLFMLSLLESAGIPIPSEIVLPFAGFLVATARFSLWPTALVATLGNFAGSVILFWIGYSGGRWILIRYGRYLLIHRADIEKGDAWFLRHGSQAVFWGRLMPIVRTFISLPAGVGKMDFKKFSLYTLAGALPWNLALVYAGFKAGEHWDAFHPYFHYADIVIIGAVVCFVLWYVIRKRHSFHA